MSALIFKSNGSNQFLTSGIYNLINLFNTDLALTDLFHKKTGYSHQKTTTGESNDFNINGRKRAQRPENALSVNVNEDAALFSDSLTPYSQWGAEDIRVDVNNKISTGTELDSTSNVNGIVFVLLVLSIYRTEDKDTWYVARIIRQHPLTTDESIFFYTICE